MKPRTALIALAIALALAPIAQAQDVLFSLRNQHADPHSQVNADNIGQLQPAWFVRTEAPVSHAPLVRNGRVYFADWSGQAYAVDAQSGKVVWRRQIEKPKTQWPWHGLAGTGALGENMLFEASVEGTAYALDLETGKPVWKTRIAEDPEAGSLGALLYHDGVVFVGLQSVEEPLTRMKKDFKPDFRGKVMALDASSGKKLWERRLVEPPHNGVAMWTSFALDPDLNLLYFNTGNNYTGEATALSDSMIAVDAKTGEIAWSQQATPHDVWTPVKPLGPDYDFSGGPQLFEAEVDGKKRLLVGAAQKSGFFLAYDRKTGEPVWKTGIGYGGVDGGMHSEASIGGDRVLAWSNNGYHHTVPPAKAPLSVKAVDTATGKPLWVRNEAQPAAIFASGFLASDVYFVGSLDGQARAYRVADGERVWTSQKHSPIIASLLVADGMLLFGTGTPGVLKWAKGENGMVAYRLAEKPGGQEAGPR